jgi:hypothetical protein
LQARWISPVSRSTKAQQEEDQFKESMEGQSTNYKPHSSYFTQSLIKKKIGFFDSGCSKHMTRDKTCFEELKPYRNNYVTVGDGEKGRIKGICKLVSPGSPSLDDVLLVEGLTSNLISINQLCDQGLNVNFNNSQIIVSRKDQEVLTKGSISKDYSYL